MNPLNPPRRAYLPSRTPLHPRWVLFVRDVPISRCGVPLTRACRALRPPGAVSLSASSRRCCCSWSGPRRRPATPPGSTDEGDDRLTAPRVEAAAVADRRGRRPLRSARLPGRRPSSPWHSQHLFPASAAEGATWALADTARPGTAPTSSAGYAVPAPYSRRRLRENLSFESLIWERRNFSRLILPSIQST